MTLDAVVRVSLGSFSLDVELNVADNEMIAVLGPNGSGKTTLLRTLSGLLPIDAGQIVIDGNVVDDPDAGCFVPAERRSVGVVFQDYLLFTHLSALDNVAFGLRERGRRKTSARAQARRVLTVVAAEINPTARPAQLSGGQAQRVALARALAIEPRLLLLDEPLAALDAQTRVATRRHLHDVLAQVKGTRVLVTHDPIDALTLADRLLILQNGHITQQGTPNEVLARPKTAYVAELAGVNLYRGRGVGDLIHVQNHVLTAVGTHDGEVLAIIPPHAVVLHRQQPEGSARNAWQGSITAIEPFAGRVRVRVDGTIPIIAEVTPDAVTALDLIEGITVWVAVKATEVEVYPT